MQSQTPSLDAIKHLHRDLYHHFREQSLRLAEHDNRDLDAYLARFEVEDCPTMQPISASNMLAELAHSRLVLYGDFHSLPQSQLQFLRTLEAMYDRCGSSLTVGLEMFGVEDQASLGAYTAGALSFAGLLQQTNLEKNWPFPIEQYRPILEFCRLHKLRTFGFNNSSLVLHERDEFAAGLFMTILRENPEAHLLVMFGECHLAEAHLPRVIKHYERNGLDVDYRCILMNPVAETPSVVLRRPGEQYFKAGRRTFLSFHAPAWMKWQSFLYLQEKATGLLPPESRLHDPDFDEYEASGDLDTYIQTLYRYFSGFMGLPDADKRGEFEVRTHCLPDTASLLTHLRHLKLKPVVKQLILSDCVQRGFSVGADGDVYLVKLSLNNTSKVVGLMLRRLNVGMATEKEGRFWSRTWDSCAAHLCANLLNPFRHMPSLPSSAEELMSLRSRVLLGIPRQRRMMCNDLLKLVEDLFKGDDLERRKLPRWNGSTNFADYAGEIFAGMIFKNLISGRVSREDLIPVFIDKQPVLHLLKHAI